MCSWERERLLFEEGGGVLIKAAAEGQLGSALPCPHVSLKVVFLDVKACLTVSRFDCSNDYEHYFPLSVSGHLHFEDSFFLLYHLTYMEIID